jgi:hypothetical protein
MKIALQTLCAMAKPLFHSPLFGFCLLMFGAYLVWCLHQKIMKGGR